jgi:hypothetical protein
MKITQMKSANWFHLCCQCYGPGSFGEIVFLLFLQLLIFDVLIVRMKAVSEKAPLSVIIFAHSR